MSNGRSRPPEGCDFADWARRQPGALVSGPKVADDFTEGWGHPPFMRGMKAHYWRVDLPDLGDGAYGLRSACGVLTVATKHVPLMQPGNLPFCTRCEGKLMKAVKA